MQYTPNSCLLEDVTRYNVIIDGDNVPLEKYHNIVEPELKELYQGLLSTPLLICQSNIIFKYKRGHQFDIQLQCSQTSKKNSADARIIFEAGRMYERGEHIIIVSNDNIYKELECAKIIVHQFDAQKKEINKPH